MLKRLNRLQEALSDLEIALPLAKETYETNDIRYNLACVHAMLGNRDKMLGFAYQLRDAPTQLNQIEFHLHDYFRRFEKDKDLLAILG